MATVSPDDGRAVPEILGRLGPNWFASVMGTGIVATAAATLPVHVPGLRTLAGVGWVLGAVLRATRRWPISTAPPRWRSSPSARGRFWSVKTWSGTASPWTSTGCYGP